MTHKIKYLGLFFAFLFAAISCEKDFKDVNSPLIGNDKFETKQTSLEVATTNQSIDRVRADGINLNTRMLGEYWLGVYNNTQKTAYKKLEASVVSQLIYLNKFSDLSIAKKYDANTKVVTKMDKVFLILPYKSTDIRKAGDSKPKFRLDDILGNQSKGFSVKVFQNNTPLDNSTSASKVNTNVFYSDMVYQNKGDILNEDPDFKLKPNPNDTIYNFDRHQIGEKGEAENSKEKTTKESIKLANDKPFAVIPLDKDKIKKIFLDQYGSSNFASDKAFRDYFNGLIIEATGDEGSLIPFNFHSLTSSSTGRGASNILNGPSLKICYTNTILKAGKVTDIVKKTDTYYLTGVVNSVYKMTTVKSPATKNIIIQGTAGSMGEIKIFQGDELKELRAKKWLITDASLTFYVDKDVAGDDVKTTPSRLLLYKRGVDSKGKIIESQIKDAVISNSLFDGKLQLKDDKPDKYRFRITYYISDLLSGKTNYNPPLRLKVYNPTDRVVSLTDTIVRTYNWNPRAVTLLNHLPVNGDRKVELKISYSVKKQN